MDDLLPLVPTSHFSSEYANQPMGVRGNLKPPNCCSLQKFSTKSLLKNKYFFVCFFRILGILFVFNHKRKKRLLNNAC